MMSGRHLREVCEIYRIYTKDEASSAEKDNIKQIAIKMKKIDDAKGL